MKFAALARSAALVTAVALIPATTAGIAQVDGRVGPEFSKLFATYQRIKANYVEPVDDEKLIRGAIDGMLASLDPHSAYLDGSDLQRLETMIDGNYSGLGLSVVMDDGAVKIISPFRGSPAEEAGLKAGDFITHLDGDLIYGGDLDDAVSRMRGPAGTSIRLTVFRSGRDEPFDVTVTRGVIELEPVTYKIADGNIGIISVNEFSRDVGADVFAAWKAMERDATGRMNGLVLDLRSNPGGSLDEAVALSDLFLDRGRIVSQRGRARGETIFYDAETAFRGITISHADRVIFSEAGITKGDLAAYCDAAGERLFELAGHRPVSLLRCPSGAGTGCFFQKHAGKGFPREIDAIAIEEAGGGGEDYMVIRQQAGFVAAVQMGTIEFHVWGAKEDRLEQPDRLVFDLDPDEGLGFSAVTDAAIGLRDLLGQLDLPAIPMVTGGKGVHVITPLRRGADWETVRIFARTIASHCADRYPDRFTASMSKQKRKGRIFIDWLRNERGATAIAPYSVRNRAGAPVAMPLTWDELAGQTAADGFSIADALKRLSGPCPLIETRASHSISKSVVARLDEMIERGSD